MANFGGQANKPLPSFGTIIQDDIDRLRPGQAHALLHVRCTKGSFDANILERIWSELPTKARTSKSSDTAVLIWLPQTTATQASTQARLIRQMLAPLKAIDAKGQNNYALGVVSVNRSNWNWEAVLRTAEVTAAYASISGTNSIRVVNQISGQS